jgi:hypothetical protein
MNILGEYTDPLKPGSFSGKSSFLRELKKRSKSRRQLGKLVKKTLENEETYTLHRPIRKKISRNRVIVNGIDDTFQADLVDVSKISGFNESYTFILTCIDVFSKYAWAIPIRDKSAKSVVEGFKVIFADGRIPRRIQTDQGNEFLNKEMNSYLKIQKHEVKLYIINSEMKASVIERFNRTLKERMWRYFTFKQSYRYLDILQKLVQSYNNSFHRSIKTSPSQVNKKNERHVWKILYGHDQKVPIDQNLKFKFKLGDLVRISKSKNIFEKGYTANWTREFFKIHEILPRKPPVYKIIDIHPSEPEIIQGVFYEEQLQKIEKLDDVFYVESVLGERKVRNDPAGGKEYLIKWLGYPSKFNSWEPKNSILKVFDSQVTINESVKNNFKSSSDQRIEFSV